MGLSVRFPRHSVWPILPGVRSFLNCEKGLGDNSGLGAEFTFAGMSRARSGMWRSPMTRTRREVMMAAGVVVEVVFGKGYRASIG